MDMTALAHGMFKYAGYRVLELVAVGDQRPDASHYDFVAVCEYQGSRVYVAMTLPRSGDGAQLLTVPTDGAVSVNGLTPGAAKLANRVLDSVGAKTLDPEVDEVIAALAGVPAEIIGWALKVRALPPDVLGLLTMEEFNGRDALAVSEVAARLGVSTDAIYDVIRAGELATVQFNRRVLIPVESYVDFYNAHYRASLHEDPFA